MPSPFGPYDDAVDLSTEFLFAAILVMGAVVLIHLGRRRGLSKRSGWLWIPSGLLLLGIMASLDFADEFNDTLWVVAGLDLEPYFEDLLMPLAGVSMLVAGILRWAPLHAHLEQAKTEAQKAEVRRLKEMDEFKTTFLNTAAHELATPLTPIRLQLSLMNEEEADEEKAGQVQVLQRNFRRLERLVTDLMDAARLQSGKLSFSPAELDLSRLLAEVEQAFQPRMNEVGQDFTVDVEPGIVLEAADDLRLSQVVYNLIGNAIKFTPAGGSVSLSARRDGTHAVLEVADTGHGMEASELNSLFAPFQQHHRDLVGAEVGTGLGLYVSQGIVELHSGQITAQSDGREKGTRFTVRLPINTSVTATANEMPIQVTR